MKFYLVSEAAAAESQYEGKSIATRAGVNVASGKITRPDDVIGIVGDFLRQKRQEYFLAITMNGAGEILGVRIITIGILNHSLVHPREVFRDAILDSAASLIVVHNHPSGSTDPSPEDIAITRQLSSAADILGIRLIDHVIIARNCHCSFKERGLL